jgi:dihydroxy-acid dehydratase
VEVAKLIRETTDFHIEGLRLSGYPEAYVGGPIAAVREGDIIAFDIPNRRLDIKISDEEMAERLKSWTKPEPRYTWGVFAKYAALVSSASQGAVTDAGS